jgi:hypothetical protein
MVPSFKLIGLDAARAAGFPQAVRSGSVDSMVRPRHFGAMSKRLLSSSIVSRTAAATTYYAYRQNRAGPG